MKLPSIFTSILFGAITLTSYGQRGGQSAVISQPTFTLVGPSGGGGSGGVTTNADTAKALYYPGVSAYPLVYTNTGGQPDALLLPLTQIDQGSTGDRAIPIIIPNPMGSSCGGFFFPMFTTNSGTGRSVWSILANGQTNYLHDLKAGQWGAVPENSIDIGGGTIGGFNDPGYSFAIGGFFNGGENHWIYQDATNWNVQFPLGTNGASRDARNAPSVFVVDEKNNYVIVSNNIKVGTNIFMGYGNAGMSGGQGSALFTNAGGSGTLYLDPTQLSPLGAAVLTNLQIQPSPATGTLGRVLGLGFIAEWITNYNLIIGDGFAGAPGIQISSVGNATKGTTAVLLYSPYKFGWTTDGGGDIGTTNDARPANVYIKNTNNCSILVMGAITNVASFTLIQTNWIDGSLNTNQTGRPIYVVTPCKLTTTGVSGNASYSLQVPGQTTNQFGIATIVTSIAMSYTNQVSAFVPAGSTYTFTNTSSGAGDSGAILNGGQYMVY